MIIDFHTHTFPEKIAAKALGKLSASSGMLPHTDGIESGLITSMQEAGIDLSVILPVITSPDQTEKIHQNVYRINELTESTGLLSFGGIHPDNDNYRNLIQDLARHHVKGIKIHPAFTATDFDDIRYQRIISCATEYGLIVITHAGIDISFLDHDYASPSQIQTVLRAVQPDKLVLAHMGGWRNWEEVLDTLAGEQVYLDTAFSLTPLATEKGPDGTGQLDNALFLRMVQEFGANHILFGSDSPWSSQTDSIAAIQQSGLSDLEISHILGDNAKGLLQL